MTSGQNIPYFENVYIWEYDLYLEIHRIIGGMAPYKRKIVNGKLKWIPSAKPRLGNILNIAVIVSITVFCQYKSLEMSDSSDPVSFYATVIQGFTIVMVMLITQIIFIFTHGHTLQTYMFMEKIDKELRNFDIFVSYKWIIFLTYFGSAALWTVGILLMAFSNRTTWKMVYDFVGFFYPLIVRFILLWFPLPTFTTLIERFYQLNTIMKRLEKEFHMKEKNRKYTQTYLDPEYTLNTVTTLHAKLVMCNTYALDTYGLIILVNVIYNLVHFIMGIYFTFWGNSVSLTNFEMLCTTIGLTIQMSAIYLLGYFTQTMAHDCLTTLGYLHILYSKNELAFMKNTFLLQSLHLKINTDICGLFPLNMSILLKQMNFCNTFIVLLIQYQRSYSN